MQWAETHDKTRQLFHHFAFYAVSDILKILDWYFLLAERREEQEQCEVEVDDKNPPCIFADYTRSKQ